MAQKKKIVCLWFADQPCFIAADPTIFFSENKKLETVVRSCLSDPGF